MPGWTVLWLVLAAIFLFIGILSWKDSDTSIVLLSLGFVLAIMAAIAMLLG